MVGEDLARDLLRFKKPILVLGDPAQLPPIKDAGYFINAEPDILLTEVHRQAQNNPIIKSSMDIR
jgi:exodeoxyribonuclease-5